MKFQKKEERAQRSTSDAEANVAEGGKIKCAYCIRSMIEFK